MAWICDKTGQQKCEIKKLSYNGVFMDVSSITVTVESAVPIAFAIGDYIDWDYDGLRYTLDAAAGVEKQARKQTIGNAFVYDNLVFLSPLKAADNAEFLDVIIGNTNEFLTNTEFSFYGTAWDYAKRLEANLCRMYGDGSWKVRIWTGGTCYDETPATGINTGSWENKLVDVSGIKCLGGFQQIYDLWGCAYVFSVNNGVNYVDFYDDFEQYAQAWKESGVDKIFAYGKGNGLYKIRHTQDTDHVLVTRLRPYGSSDNLPANYYLNSPDYHVDGNESSELAISRLMLPASQWTKNGVKQPANAYLEQNTDLYGVREASVCWDGSDPELGEIKPTIYNLTIQDLLDLMASGTTYRPNTAKWPDTSQRIDKIITGAAPTDNGAVAEAGYDFTVVESNGALSAHEFGVMRVNKVVDFSDLVMGTTPSISHLAEFRIVPTSSNTVAVSFDVPDTVVSAISLVTAYLTPYVGNEKVSDATFPCAVSHEEISVTEDGVHYTRRYKIRLLDSAENPIVFSTMLTGQVTFRIYAEIHFISGREPDASIPVIRTEYAVAFNLLRGNKAIDKFFSVTIPQVGFDLAAAVTSGARLCMRSGANQPREFQIVPSSVRYIESSDTWYFRCKRSLDQSISTYFPNSDSVIAAGDEFYFSGIAMPALYVEIAAQKLLTAATAWLALHSKPRMLSSVDVDNKIMAKESIVLKEGMSLPLSDTDLGITPQNQESRIIDNIRIEEGSDSIRTFSITLRDKKEKSSLDQAIRGATSNFATNTSVAEAIGAVDNRDHGSLSGRDMPNQHPISSITGLEEALAALSFFEKDGNGNVKLKDEYGGLWTAGFMTAGGIGSGGGGGGGLVEQIFRIGDFGETFDEDGNDTFNAYAINTLHERILALELHPGGVTSVAGLTGAISATALYDALGLNTEMGIIGKGLQSLQSQIDSVASRDMFDELKASSLFSDNIATISMYAESIILNGADLATKLATYALKATSITGTGYLIGGGDLSANRTLDIAETYKTYIQHGESAYNRTNWDNYFGVDEDGNVYVKMNGDDPRGFYSFGFIAAGGIGSGGGGGGGLIEAVYRIDDLGDTFEEEANDTFNAYAINSLHQRILTLEQHPGGVTSVAGLTGDISTAQLATALGITNLNNDLTTISDALKSLQSQVDSVAARDSFDEIIVSAIFADQLSASFIHVEESELGTVKSGVWNGTKIANDYLVNTTIGVGSAVITLGSSATLSQIGIPTWAQKAQLEFTDLPAMYVARTQVKGTADNDTLLGITAISNAASSDATDASRIEWDATNNAWHFIGNLYADGFIAAGGVGSTSGGGVDLDRVWQSLTNEVADDYANTLIDTHHIPDMASVYGYLKVNQVITLTGVVTGSGSTTISTSIADGALTIAKTSGLQTALDAKQATISDLETIRSNASHGETAYGWGNHATAGYLTSTDGATISGAIQSLQAQIDSVASRDNFDEIIASAAFVDALTASMLYAGSIDLAGSDLSTTLTNINGKISTLEGYFDSSGNAKSALKLTTVSKTIWGVTYWTQNGVPDNVTGRPNLFIGTTQVQTSSATQALTGITTGAFSSDVTVGGTLGVTGLVTAASGLKLSTTKKIWFGDDYYIELVNIAESGETPIYAIHSNAGFYSDSFITAGGIATSSGSGTIDLDRLWQSLTNEVADDYSETLIATAHIPDMAQIYSYVKTSAISDMATKTWVTSQGYVSSADLDVVDITIRSLQAQIDSVASIWDGDEICTIALYADSVSSIDLYVTNVHLGDKTLTETSTIVTINGTTVALGGSMSTASITAGTAGTSSSTSGTTISIPYVTMNQYGIVTGYGTHSHTISAANIVSALGNTAVNRATADASGNTITTTYITVSRLDSDELTLAAALESLQSQIDAVASRNDFDEIIATVVDSDTISAQNGYFVALSGSLSGNATTASYLVGSSYGVGSASLPVYFSGGLPVACTASSLFSGLSSSAGTNLSITIAGQNRTATLYATYDSASENISSTFGSVSTYLQSLQAQIDSVAAARSFDELTITSLYADTLSVGANVIIGGTTHSVGGIDSESYITAGAAYTSSDKRLKDDIKSVSASRAWAVLMALSPSEWTWNDKNDYLGGKQGAGLVAQDVSDVLPFSVLDFGDYLSLNYSVFHAYEIAGLQDHEKRIRQLEKENKELKAKLNIC